MNSRDLKTKVHSSMYALLQSKGHAAVDLLQDMGILSRQDYENWRFGRIPYLERVCRINLGKLSTIMREMRSYASEKLNGPTQRITYPQKGQRAPKFQRHRPMECLSDCTQG